MGRISRFKFWSWMVLAASSLLFWPRTVSAQEPGPRSGAVIWVKGFAMNFFWVREAHEGLLSASNHIEDPLGRRLVQQRWPIQAAYSPFLNFQLFASLPVKQMTKSWDEGQGRLTQRTRGVGDLLLLARYRIWRKDVQGGTNQVTVSFGPEIPIGQDDLRDADGRLYEPALQPGSGSWNWLGAVAAAYPRGRIENGTSMVFKIFTENDQGLRRSNWVEFHHATHYRVIQKKYPGIQLAIGGGLNYQHLWRAELNGQPLPNSGGDRLSLVLPDGHFVPFVWLMLHYEIQWTLWQKANGQQLREQSPFLAFWVHWQYAF